MRLQTAASLAVFSSLASALGFDCKHIKIDNYKYDLSPLGGAHEITHSVSTDDFVTNTTYRLNICNILGDSAHMGDATCGTSKNSTFGPSRPQETRPAHAITDLSHLVCGFVNRSPVDGNGDLTFGFPIVGLEPLGEGSKDPEVKRLKEIDAETEGLRVKLAGGSYKGDGNDQKVKKAAAVIEFQCDNERSGLEGLHTLAEAEPKERRRREEETAPKTNSSSLQFKSFALADDDTYVLRLDWRTKYACDNFEGDTDKPSTSNSWGFFTWLIIM